VDLPEKAKRAPPAPVVNNSRQYKHVVFMWSADRYLITNSLLICQQSQTYSPALRTHHD